MSSGGIAPEAQEVMRKLVSDLEDRGSYLRSQRHQVFRASSGSSVAGVLGDTFVYIAEQSSE